MEIAEHDLAVLIDEIWLTTLGLATHPVRAGDATTVQNEPTLDGIINITGDCQATVALQLPRPLAARIAAIMFHMENATPSLEDMQDAVGELTNMLGGNIKALLGGDCHLSLPAVVEGRAYTVRVPSSHVLRHVEFGCDGYSAVVNLLAVGARPVAVQ